MHVPQVGCFFALASFLQYPFRPSFLPPFARAIPSAHTTLPAQTGDVERYANPTIPAPPLAHLFTGPTRALLARPAFPCRSPCPSEGSRGGTVSPHSLPCPGQSPLSPGLRAAPRPLPPLSQTGVQDALPPPALPDTPRRECKRVRAESVTVPKRPRVHASEAGYKRGGELRAHGRGAHPFAQLREWMAHRSGSAKGFGWGRRRRRNAPTCAQRGRRCASGAKHTGAGSCAGAHPFPHPRAE